MTYLQRLADHFQGHGEELLRVTTNRASTFADLRDDQRGNS